jgi:hypothetical protein
MPYHSLNPILASFTTPDPYLPVELEVYIENADTDDVFDSLGTFSLISDAEGGVAERIESALHAALMERVDLSMPSGAITAAIVLGISRKFKFRHRHFVSDAWSSWTNSSTDFVVLGGQPFEDFANTFNTVAASAPIVLLPETSAIGLKIAQGYIDVLCQAAGTASVRHLYFNSSGASIPDHEETVSLDREYRVVRVPVFPPGDGREQYFSVEVTVDGVTRTVQLVVDRQYRHKSYNFCWLSSRGGWAFLETQTGKVATLEVSQNVAERYAPAQYFDQADISTARVWKTKGMKRIKTATGFWPAEYLDITIQDFMLSPLRFVWDQDRNRWIPILVNSRSATYLDESGSNIRSYMFEFSPAFDTNLPSSL